MSYPCLKGLRVVDFGIITAGASTSAMLADLGAEVVKIEGPAYIDPFRTWTGVSGAPDWWNKSPHFAFTNRNKRSFCVDLKRAEGRRLVLDLVARSDVVVENFRVGALDKLGLGFDNASRVNPRIVFASISSQGGNGPDAHSVSFGSTLEASSGFSSLVRTAHGEPLISGHALNYPDQIVSLFALGIILTALVEQLSDQRAVHLDIAQRELTSFMLGDLIAAGAGTAGGPGAPSVENDVVRAADGRFVAYTIATPEDRDRVRDALRASGAGHDTIAGAIASMSASQAVRVLSRTGTAAEIAITAQEMREVPAGTLAFARDAAGQPAKGLPWSYGGRAAGVDRGAPRLGEDNEYVVRRILELGESEYRALDDQGVLGTAPAARTRTVDADADAVPVARK